MNDKMKVREDVNQKLREEFELVHGILTKRINELKQIDMVSVDTICKLIDIQIRLARQIVREEKAINRKGTYAFPLALPNVGKEDLLVKLLENKGR